jgi:hypothetical protein
VIVIILTLERRLPSPRFLFNFCYVYIYIYIALLVRSALVYSAGRVAKETDYGGKRDLPWGQERDLRWGQKRVSSAAWVASSGERREDRRREGAREDDRSHIAGLFCPHSRSLLTLGERRGDGRREGAREHGKSRSLLTYSRSLLRL